MTKSRALVEQYGLAGLQLIVLAAAYEIHDNPLASDSTYDILCKTYDSDRIPGFDPSTGQWVHDVMTPELEDLVEHCIKKVQSVPHDGMCHHTYIAEYFGLAPDDY